MDQYTGRTYSYAELAESFINFLHYCSPSSAFYGTGTDSRGKRTNSLFGCYPTQTVGAPPPPSPIFMLNALSAATIPIYPGLGQAPNTAGLHT